MVFLYGEDLEIYGGATVPHVQHRAQAFDDEADDLDFDVSGRVRIDYDTALGLVLRQAYAMTLWHELTGPATNPAFCDSSMSRFPFLNPSVI